MEGRIGGGRYCSKHGEWLPNAHMDKCSKCVKEREDELLKKCPQWIKDMADALIKRKEPTNDR